MKSTVRRTLGSAALFATILALTGCTYPPRGDTGGQRDPYERGMGHDWSHGSYMTVSNSWHGDSSSHCDTGRSYGSGHGRSYACDRGPSWNTGLTFIFRGGDHRGGLGGGHGGGRSCDDGPRGGHRYARR